MQLFSESSHQHAKHINPQSSFPMFFSSSSPSGEDVTSSSALFHTLGGKTPDPHTWPGRPATRVVERRLPWTYGRCLCSKSCAGAAGGPGQLRCESSEHAELGGGSGHVAKRDSQWFDRPRVGFSAYPRVRETRGKGFGARWPLNGL